MALSNKNLRKEIEKINESFDKGHYLKIKSRAIHIVYRILRYKSVEYKQKINLAQVQSGRAGNFKLQHRDLVACTIAGKTANAYSLGTSHKVLAKPERRMAQLLAKLGSIGGKSAITGSKNIIGKCAEVKSANRLLSTNSRITEKEIEFTPAIRPRTMENIPRCPNCSYIFGKEK